MVPAELGRRYPRQHPPPPWPEPGPAAGVPGPAPAPPPLSCSMTVFMRCLNISQSFPSREHLSPGPPSPPGTASTGQRMLARQRPTRPDSRAASRALPRVSPLLPTAPGLLRAWVPVDAKWDCGKRPATSCDLRQWAYHVGSGVSGD